MKKSSLVLALAGSMLLAACGHRVLTPEEVSSYQQEQSAKSSSSASTSSSSSSSSSSQVSTQSASETSTESSTESASQSASESTSQSTSSSSSKADVYYTVTFNTQGGSDVAAQQVKEGETAVKPDDPTKDGYEFKGWYEDVVGLTAFDFTTAITEDITIYAVWEEEATVDYTLTIGGTAYPLSNDSNADKDGDTWVEQYKATGIEAEAGDAILFSKGGDAILPGASGKGNNAKFDAEAGLSVITGGEGLTIYLKVYTDGYDVWLTGYDAGGEGGEVDPDVDYTLTIGETAYPLSNDSDADKDGDTWVEQYKATGISAEAGDAIQFKKGNDAIHPGASGKGNNAKFDAEDGLSVITGGEGLTIYLKVYADGYDVWLTGYDAGGEGGEVDPEQGVTVTFTCSYDTGYGKALFFLGDFNNWVKDEKSRMAYADGAWSISITKPAGTVISYKLAVSDYTDFTADSTWQGGDNRSYTFPAEAATVNVAW